MVRKNLVQKDTLSPATHVREFTANVEIDPGQVLETLNTTEREVTTNGVVAQYPNRLLVALEHWEDGMEGTWLVGDTVRCVYLKTGDKAIVRVWGRDIDAESDTALSKEDLLVKTSDGRLATAPQNYSSVTDESITVAATVGNDSPHALANGNIVPGSVFASIDGGNDLVEGIDYFIDYQQGQISFAGDNQLTGGETVLVDYEYGNIYTPSAKALEAVGSGESNLTLIEVL